MTPTPDTETEPETVDPGDRVAGYDQPLSMVRAAALGRRRPVLASTPLGTIDAAAIADVDHAGWVQLRGARWSLDWWIGAEDRWHQPAREPAVRQRPVDAAPVIETSMRVPGGDVVHRAFGVRATSPADDGTWDDSAVVVELENQTAVPVAAALVIRPLTLAGTGGVRSVEVDGSVVRVDGRVAAVVSRPVARIAHGPLGSTAAALVGGEDDQPTASIPAVPGDGLEVALVVPLPHTAVVRVLLPRVAAPSRRSWFSRRATPAPSATFDAPDAATIASGWEVHTRGAARVELGEPLLDRTVVAAQRSLSLGSTDHVLARADRAVEVTELLARSGLVEPLGPLARALVDTQRLGGAVTLDDDGDATAALLFAAAPLLATGSEIWDELLVGPVAKSVHLVRKGGALQSPESVLAGVRALALVAPALRRVGQPDVAEDAETAAADLSAARLSSGAAGSSGPTTGDTLLDVLGSVRRRLAAGDAGAVAELVELARLGEPGAVGDRYDELGTPDGELGFDPGAVAARASAVMDLALRDDTEGPSLMPVWPESWWGRSVEAHAVLTRFGRTSFALRWHGARPAVLWEVEPAPGVSADSPGPVLSCPGLDPQWRGQGWSGEALLSEVEPPAGLVDRTAEASVEDLRITPTRVDLPAPPEEGQSFL